jgi:phosphoenolpyruvate---glycerone phosphotransferase subunit DhaM
MIGLLLISHSADIARGVKALADQMARGQIPIAAAGGTLEGDLGTSADVITSGLSELQSAEAVLALVDMGSAVMSAEMALEMSGVRFHLSGAPLVEGAIVAAVEATRPGVTLEEVVAAAERALETKGIAPLAPSTATQTEAAPPQPADRITSVLTIRNTVGLHMRPASEFVKTAARFKAGIRARNLDRPASRPGNAKSLLDVMKLGVSQGHRIELQIDGEDAQEALSALEALVAANFGERE